MSILKYLLLTAVSLLGALQSFVWATMSQWECVTVGLVFIGVFCTVAALTFMIRLAEETLEKII